MRIRPRSLTLAALLLSSPAYGTDLMITDAWIRAMPGHLPAAGYFTIRNGGRDPVSLSGASSPACGMLMLHRSSSDNGMSSMSDVESIAIPAGGTMRFAPGGYHLMCMDPKPLMHGARVPITLQFSNGRTLATTFLVKDARGR